MKIKTISISEELILARSYQGVKLVEPQQYSSTGFSIGKLLHWPLSFYFLDITGKTQIINETGVEACGYQSRQDAIGKSLYEVTVATSAAILLSNCKSVISANQIKIFEEENVRKDQVGINFLSVKAPWYDQGYNIIGTFGCSIILGQQSLAESLAKISELGLLSPSSSPVKNNLDMLSKQEQKCVQLLSKGYTFKEIAREMVVSPRTVECYVQRAKEKWGCQSRLELVTTFSSQSY